MTAEDLPATLDELMAEKAVYECRLDEALRSFAEYEERMNAHWQTADAEARRRLMDERTRVEDSLGIVALVEYLDRIREKMGRLHAV